MIDSTRPLPPGGLRLLLVTLVALLVMALFASLVTSTLFTLGDLDVSRLGPEDIVGERRHWLRLALLSNNLLLFAGAAMLALWFHYRSRWSLAAGLATPSPGTGRTLLAVAFFTVSLPVVALLTYLNLRLPLPDWVFASEDTTNALLANILTMESFGAFLLTLLTVAVTPAIGEELLLRGVLQRRILGEWLGSHHLAIWLAAAIFSFVHLEFAGFLPRLALGVSLGYAYHWTGSLWVPILLHFLFNGFQVTLAYVTGEFIPDTEMSSMPSWWLVGAAVVGSGWLWLRAERNGEGPAPQSL